MSDKRLWVYHADKEPKIILRHQLETHYNNGWRESPALCAGYTTKIKDTIEEFTIGQIETNKNKGNMVAKEDARKIAIDEIGRHQAGVIEQMNKNANDDKWIKEQRENLEQELIDNFGHNPDMRKYRGYKGLLRLDKLFREFENGNS
jgi:hypothetical protein